MYSSHHSVHAQGAPSTSYRSVGQTAHVYQGAPQIKTTTTTTTYNNAPHVSSSVYRSPANTSLQRPLVMTGQYSSPAARPVSAPLQSYTPGNNFVLSGTTGSIPTDESPYPYTTVTYAKTPYKSRANEYYAAHQMTRSPDLQVRMNKRTKGACGGLNDLFCGSYDSNGGMGRIFNCDGMCNRPAQVPNDAGVKGVC